MTDSPGGDDPTSPGSAPRRAPGRLRPAQPTSPGVTPEADLPEFLTGALDIARPDEPDVDEEMLATLIELGVEPDEARRAIVEDRVALVLSRQIFEEEARYDLDDLVEESGIEAETILLLRSALGLPFEERYTQLDMDWITQLSSLLEVLSLETVVRSARTRGAAMATVAMSDMGVVRDELILPLRQAGADDLTVGIALAEATKAITPTSDELLRTTYTLQVRHLLSTELAATAARGESTQMLAAVGFVDIVGYTRLSARIDPSGLDTLIEAFEQRVVEVTSARRDVAVVKYLGDAAMLVGPDAVTLADAMLELSTEVEPLADAPVRGGMATGNVLARDGDYFGPAVNLAARLTDVSRPWRVLVAEDDVADVRARFRVERVRPLRLRGIGTSRPGSIRRRLDADELAEEQRKRSHEEAVEASHEGSA